jgi:hypothetical protein
MCFLSWEAHIFWSQGSRLKITCLSSINFIVVHSFIS